MKNITLPEIIAIGIYDSRIAVKNRDITKNRKTAMFEIELPMENGGTSYIDDHKVKITPDTLICAKPGQIRHTKLPFKCHYIHMSLHDGALYDILMNTPDYLPVDDPERYRDIFISLCDYYNNALDVDSIMLQSLILKLVHMLHNDTLHHVSLRKIRNTNYEIIKKSIEYIDNNFTSPILLEDIAKHVSLSPTYFHTAFKSATGRTPNQYLNEKRIKKSVNLLVTTDLSLAQIAYECGFSSQSYFSYAFKKAMNMTPRGYARKIVGRY